MDTDNTENSTNDIESLREEINQNEQIIQNYLKTARNMKWMCIGTTILSVILFIAGSTLSGSLGLIIAFFCLRKYNRSIGMSEVYSGVTKFLRMSYKQRLTGGKTIFDLN